MIELRHVASHQRTYDIFDIAHLCHKPRLLRCLGSRRCLPKALSYHRKKAYSICRHRAKVAMPESSSDEEGAWLQSKAHGQTPPFCQIRVMRRFWQKLGLGLLRPARFASQAWCHLQLHGKDSHAGNAKLGFGRDQAARPAQFGDSEFWTLARLCMLKTNQTVPGPSCSCRLRFVYSSFCGHVSYASLGKFFLHLSSHRRLLDGTDTPLILRPFSFTKAGTIDCTHHGRGMAVFVCFFSSPVLAGQDVELRLNMSSEGL